ncbi:hypothetical protein EVA_16879 [gut metagenome]|uniref:Uncharacterized protein n=1 Tax=gut metagenome TaxID=749906 RepID=J9C5B3_9ZZZZ
MRRQPCCWLPALTQSRVFCLFRAMYLRIPSYPGFCPATPSLAICPA